MSNFFEQELRKLFGDGKIISDPTYSGRVCFGTLGRDLRVRAQFVTSGHAERYDSLKITVLNRTDGPVDTLMLRLKDLLGKKPVPGNPNFRNGVSPYIWVYQGEAEWYAYHPTAADYKTIQQAAEQYLGVFRDRSQDRTQDGPKAENHRTVPTERQGRTMSDLKNALQKRLEENYAAYAAQLTKKSFADLIDAAEEIAAAKYVCEHLATACTDKDAALLLRFENPLEVMRDRWLEETGVDRSEEISHMIWSVQDKIEDFLLDYTPAKPQSTVKKQRRYQHER